MKVWPLMRIVLLICAVELLLLASGCATMKQTGAVTETERAACEAWRDSLPSRSRSDTAQTRAEIGDGYDVFLAACPSFALPFADPPSDILGPSAGGGG